MGYFNPNVEKDHTYQELLDFKSEGHNVPDSWIIRAKEQENADAAAAKAAAEVAADFEAAKERELQRRADKITRLTPTIDEMAERLETARATETKAAEAFKAEKAKYEQARNDSTLAFDMLQSLINKEFGPVGSVGERHDVQWGDDGHPAAGTFGTRFGSIYAGAHFFDKNWRYGFEE